ncbi:MAG: serine/threonine-protein kinase [Coleofasciculaceae cyanobacterium]
MSYCLNPDCPKPQNLDQDNFCQGCGWGLLLQQRYHLIELITQTRFSRTFLAEDQQLPALPCILKQFWAQHQTVEVQEARALFQQEILLLKDLGQHPQIPTLFAHFEVKQCLYSVQEFIDGSNLAEVVQQEGTFSEVEIWQFLADILPVIKFIHDHQVIHRDLKPKNIIYRPLSHFQGEFRKKVRGDITLVDFGAAKLLTAKNIPKVALIGSPEYAAPEQLRGKAVLQSDLYSLGVTCIYLLTGIAPFELFDVVNNCWVWQDYLTEKISDNLIVILDKLLAYNLTQRFASVEQVMQAINPRQNKLKVQSSAFSILWQCQFTLSGEAAINSVAISPNGTLIASGSDDKNVYLWDIKTETLAATLTGHSQAVKSVVFSPDGTILASCSDDRTIKLWNIKECQEISTFQGHSSCIKSLSFSPDGKILASGSWDKTIKLWNLKTGFLEATLTGHNLQITAVAFSACGQFIASASCDRTVRLWNLSSGLSSIFRGHDWAVSAVAFSPDSKILATGSDDNKVILWNVKTGKAIHTFSGHSWSVVAVAFSPSGEVLFSGSWDKTIKLWNLKTNQQMATLTGHLDSVCAVAVSQNGQMIVSGSKDKTIKLWHLHK